MNEWKILLSRIRLELGMCIDTGLYFYFYLLRLDTKGNPKKDLKKFQSHIQYYYQKKGVLTIDITKLILTPKETENLLL